MSSFYSKGKSYDPEIVSRTKLLVNSVDFMDFFTEPTPDSVTEPASVLVHPDYDSSNSVSFLSNFFKIRFFK